MARALWRFPERLLHPLRRREALRYLKNRPRPGSVLIVCYGNICRSPYAAALLRRELANPPQGFRVESAGFAGSGRCCPPIALELADARGLDLSRHRSQGLTPATVRTADVVVVMDGRQRRAIRRLFGRSGPDVLVLGDLDPHPIDTRAIEDPVEQSKEVYERSYSRIERCMGQFAAAVTHG